MIKLTKLTKLIIELDEEKVERFLAWIQMRGDLLPATADEAYTHTMMMAAHRNKHELCDCPYDNHDVPIPYFYITNAYRFEGSHDDRSRITGTNSSATGKS